MAELQEAIRLNPGMPEAWCNLGFALDRTNRTDEAIASYEQALELNPHFGTAHSDFADLLAREGVVREAMDHYEQVLLINPNDRHAREMLAQAQGRAEFAVGPQAFW